MKANEETLNRRNKMINKHYYIHETQVIPYLVGSTGDGYMRKVKADLKELNEKYKLSFLELSCAERERMIEILTLKFEKLRQEVFNVKAKNIEEFEEMLEALTIPELHIAVNPPQEYESWQKEIVFETAEEVCSRSAGNAAEWLSLDAATGCDISLKEIKKVNARVLKMKKYLY